MRIHSPHLSSGPDRPVEYVNLPPHRKQLGEIIHNILIQRQNPPHRKQLGEHIHNILIQRQNLPHRKQLGEHIHNILIQRHNPPHRKLLGDIIGAINVGLHFLLGKINILKIK